MPLRPTTCHTVHCDVCAEPLRDEDELTLHVADPATAAQAVRLYGWPVAGHAWICPETDADHQAALDALLPPEPQPWCDGQMEIT